MRFSPRHSFLHAALLGLSLSLGLAACSNSNFRGDSTTQATEEEAESAPATSEDAVSAESPGNPFPAGPGIETAPISSTELSVPGALKPRPDSVFASFNTTTVKDSSLKFTLDLKGVSTDFKLEDINKQTQENFTQNTRTAVTDTFKQGNPGQAIKDEFTQMGKKGLVDILVVIDNSGSMSQEQTNLSTKLNELLVSIKDANWQIGVITTSPAFNSGVDGNAAASEGKELCNLTLIKAGDADATTKFSTAVNAGTSGNGNEQGVRQAVVGLRCTERPWIRANSTVATLIVSDEDNCSKDGGDCGTLPWAKESYAIKFVEDSLKRVIGKDAGFYGIIAPSLAACPTAVNPSAQYIRLFDFKATAGSNYGNICDASYKTTLNRISDNIALLLTSQFELKNQPDAGTLKVSVQDTAGNISAVDPANYTLSGKTLSFLAGKEPANGSKIIAEYRIGAVAMFSSVTLLQDPAPGTLSITVDGALLAANQYSLAGRVVTFAQQPAANAAISANYRQNTALADKFRLKLPPLAGTLAVRVNNVLVNTASYDAATGDLVFSPVPLDGLAIQVNYTYREGPKLSYSPAISANAKNLKLFDGAKEINFTLANGVITIGAADHSNGKTLSLKYEIPDGSARSFPLGATPLAGSAKVEMIAGDCTLGNGLSITGSDLVATCAVATRTEFILSFKYIAVNKVFQISSVTDGDKGTWKVYYKGEVTSDYSREGSKITLNFEPELDARVDISYTYPE